jgi:hypothetical protein
MPPRPWATKNRWSCPSSMPWKRRMQAMPGVGAITSCARSPSRAMARMARCGLGPGYLRRTDRPRPSSDIRRCASRSVFASREHDARAEKASAAREHCQDRASSFLLSHFLQTALRRRQVLRHTPLAFFALGYRAHTAAIGTLSTAQQQTTHARRALTRLCTASRLIARHFPAHHVRAWPIPVAGRGCPGAGLKQWLASARFRTRGICGARERLARAEGRGLSGTGANAG